MASKVRNWAEIEKDFKGSLILGNGASIAFDPRFGYEISCSVIIQ